MKVCVLNQKGGTGKTTTSIHLATSLARRHRSVILVDNDPQGSVAVSLRQSPGGLEQVLLQRASTSQTLQTVEDDLKLLASDSRLLQVENFLHLHPERVPTIFAEAFKGMEDSFVIFDMAPARSKLNEAALHLCDSVLIPVSCDFLALVGVRDILDFIDTINEKRGDRPIALKGILPTLYDSRSKICRESVEMLKEQFSDKVFPPIHQSVKVKEAPSFGKTLFDYAPQNPAAADYQWLTTAFL